MSSTIAGIERRGMVDRRAAPSHGAVSSVREMRAIIIAGMAALRDRGQAEAAHHLGRDLGLTARRVLAIFRGEVARIWADELEAARLWHVRHCEAQAALRARQADDYRTQAAALRGRLAR